MDTLSICIVNYNVRDLLENCLRSILDNVGGMDCEIIVVDNCSKDGSAEMIQKNFPHAHLIANRENRGYAYGVNQALKKAEGEILLILNADIKILPQTLHKTLDFIKKREKVGIVGCRIRNPNGTLQYSCRTFPSLINFISESFFMDRIFPRSRLFGRPFMTYFDYKRTREVDVVSGAFMMVRREAIEQIGLMDEQFFMYAEETDWCYRAQNAGWKVYFYPGTEIIHYGSESTKQNSLSMFIRLHESHHKFIRKYHGAFYLFLVKSVLISGVVLRAAGFFIGGILQRIHKNETRLIGERFSLYWNTLLWYLGLMKPAQ